MHVLLGSTTDYFPSSGTIGPASISLSDVGDLGPPTSAEATALDTCYSTMVLSCRWSFTGKEVRARLAL
jgi:hypothetical protein